MRQKQVPLSQGEQLNAIRSVILTIYADIYGHTKDTFTSKVGVLRMVFVAIKELITDEPELFKPIADDIAALCKTYSDSIKVEDKELADDLLAIYYCLLHLKRS